MGTAAKGRKFLTRGASPLTVSTIRAAAWSISVQAHVFVPPGDLEFGRARLLDLGRDVGLAHGLHHLPAISTPAALA